MRTVERGYGADHKRLRKALRLVVEAGDAICCRCGRGIAPDARWEVDHADYAFAEDGSRSVYNDGPTGPTAHRSCNQLAGARKGGLAVHRKRRMRTDGSRRWTEDWV